MRSRTEPDGEFAAIMRPHLDRLYRLAYRLAGTQADAEDLLQNVLIKLYERRDELTSVSDLGPYLGRILYNRFVDESRKKARSRLSLIDPAVLETSAIGAESLGADVYAASELSISRLDAALGALSVEHRSVVLMHDAEGYKLEEIQTITGVPIGTLKSRLHRARARLRELLEEDGTLLERAAC
jgi:RNA polymerase sigma factor (sigma-70 family)